MIRKHISLLAVAPVLAACVTSSDPGEGGFYNGIAGVSNGTYDQRVAEREAQVAEAEAENTRLTAQLASLRGEHGRAKNALIQARAAAKKRGAKLSAGQEAQVSAALRSNPNKAASLRKAIADARALADNLKRLSS